MINALALMNPAGGIRYHLRALRFGGEQWQPFRWSIGQWLLEWQPREPTLLLVGPSAGYCLQPFLFERFERVICLEPDPVARYLFKRKVTLAPLEHRPKFDFIAEDHLVRNPEGLLKLVEHHADACLLFSNVLGQLRGLLAVDDSDGPEFTRIKSAIAEATRGRSWASFHDRVSGTARPTCERPMIANSRLSDAEILELLYSETPLERRGRDLKLIDHLTEGLFPENLPHSYFSWELQPGRFHLIEAVASSV